MPGQTTKWVAPPGVPPPGTTFGAGSTSTTPLPFALGTVNSWLQSSTLNNLTVLFYPGDYSVIDSVNPTGFEHRLKITGDSNRVIRLVGIVGSTGQMPRLILTPEPTNSYYRKEYASTWPPRFFSETLLSTAASTVNTSGATFHDGIAFRFYLGRIDVENFEFDGNFDGQGAFSSSANPSGYKSGAISLTAQTGRIRNVRVRNFGSVGQVPWSIVEGSSAGIEAFPINVVTQDDLNKPSFTDAPWVIEDCEIGQSRSVHNGYGTQFMPVSFLLNNPNPPFSTSPLVLLRRCVVNGSSATVGFGTAGIAANPATQHPNLRSGRIRIEDCVTLNSGIGFNTDTYACGPWVMTNSVLLDYGNLGFLGQANSGPNHTYYTIANNLFRIRGRRQIPLYTDYYVTNSSSWGSDPSLPLGRPYTNLANGLVFQGSAGSITFSGNRFTTWPQTNFFLPSPTNTAEAVFRPVWVIPSDTYVNEVYYSRNRPSPVNITLSQGRLSTTAFDFTGTNVWPDYTGLATLLQTSAPEYTGSRAAISSLPSGFSPQGTVERVTPVYGGALSNLLSVGEVAFGQVSFPSATQLTVTVRGAEHRTLASGSPGTVVWVGSNLWLAADLQLPNGATGNVGPIGLTTTANGTATQTLPLPSSNCLVRLRAWQGPAGNSAFPSNQVAWASLNQPMGSVVSVAAQPDVGDDKNTTTAKRAKVRFTRTGTVAGLSSPLTAQFLLPTNGIAALTSPLDLRNLIANYGTSGSADYYFGTPSGGTLGTIVPGATNAVTFDANSAEVVVDVIIRSDNLTEANVARVQLIGGATYALGEKTLTDIYLYDGPEWTLIELQGDSSFQPTYDSAVTGLNSGVLNSNGQYDVNPIVVGTSAYTDTYGLAQHGGIWGYPTNYLSDFGRTFRPQAVSYREASNQHAVIVGSDGAFARMVYEDKTGGVNLARFPGVTGGTAVAYGVNVNVFGETNIVGYSTSASGVQRPVLWKNQGVPVDLAQNLPATYAGVARSSTWGESILVGEVDYLTTTDAGAQVVVRRGFRTLDATPSTIRTVDDDLPPQAGIPASSPTSAASINFDGMVVGTSIKTNLNALLTVAVLWAQRVSGPNPAAQVLDRWVPPSGLGSPDLSSTATFINDNGWISGSSQNGSGYSRAVVRKGTSPDYKWLDLNDGHFVSGKNGWSLQEAISVNMQGIIVGNGLKDGSPRGFVLVPRVQGK